MVQTGLSIVRETLEGARIESPDGVPEPLHGLLAVAQRGRFPDGGAGRSDLCTRRIRYCVRAMARLVGPPPDAETLGPDLVDRSDEPGTSSLVIVVGVRTPRLTTFRKNSSQFSSRSVLPSARGSKTRRPLRPIPHAAQTPSRVRPVRRIDSKTASRNRYSLGNGRRSRA